MTKNWLNLAKYEFNAFFEKFFFFFTISTKFLIFCRTKKNRILNVNQRKK